jgi:hypothetical protein
LASSFGVLGSSFGGLLVSFSVFTSSFFLGSEVSFGFIGFESELLDFSLSFEVLEDICFSLFGSETFGLARN